MSQPSPFSPARQRAQALASAGDLAGARSVLERAVELGKSNLSEDDPDVLLTAYELGTLLQRTDDLAGARRVLEEAYAAGQWRLGDSDPLMLSISHGIGVVAEEFGNRHEARKAFGRVAELGPAALGADHWAVVRARSYLGHDQNQAPVRPESAAQPQPEVTRPHAAGASRPSVQPPAPVDELFWTGPETNAGAAVEEPTMAQPIITPRVPAQRPAPAEPAIPPSYFPEPAPAPFPEPGPAPFPEPGPAPFPESAPAPFPEPVTEQLYPAHLDHDAGQAAMLGRPGSPGHPYFPGAVVHTEPVTAQGGASSEDHERGQVAYRKGLGLFAAIAAVLASVIAVAALVFVLANRASDSGTDTNVPTLGGPAPSDVQLRDDGTEIGITWQDPSDGTVSFMVTMGRPGELLKPVATLGPGQTSYSLNALNPGLNYCFTVIAVYRGNKYATSPQACTSRAASTTPR